jgi:hypothetical protein
MTNPAKDPMDDTLSTNPTELPTEGDAITRLCREAFKAYVGDDIYHIQVDTKYKSESGMMNYYTETDYWRYGDNWYQSYTVFERDFTYSGQDVSYEGKRLQNKYDGEWSLSNDIAEPMGPSAMELDFDRLTYLDTDAASGSRGYRFLLNGDEENVITFCFDGSGKLANMLHSFDLVTEMDTISHVTVNCRLQSTEDSNILRNIEWNYQFASKTEIPPNELVEQCKNVIESIQNADSYHYAVQFQTSDPASLLATSMEYFWYSDGNYLAYDSTRDWENQYLLVDGRYFRRDVTIAVPPEEIPYPNWTEVVPDGRNFLGKPWLMELDWDASQPELVASTEENGQRIATFSMVDPEVGNGYMLTFVFDLNSGSVISIQRTTSFERMGCTYTSTSLVFGIQLNQPQIGERIQQTYLETQLQVIE